MRAMLALAALIAAIPRLGQTAAELLQKGSYAQQTEGNLDNPIQICRQTHNSAPSQRDIAAQAQHRLAQALVRKANSLYNARIAFAFYSPLARRLERVRTR